MGRRRFLAGLGLAAATDLMTPAATAAARPADRAADQEPDPAEDPSGCDRTVVYGCLLHFLDDPGDPPAQQAWELFEDGALVIENGKVVWVGPVQQLPDRHTVDATVIDHRGQLVLPGFVDTHVHYSQVDAIASYGEQLMQWLEKYVYPAEARFDQPGHAAQLASFFLDRLLAAGTTTASVFPTVHPTSVDAFFAEAERRNLRMLCGKVLMDREPYAPNHLRDTSVTQARQQTLELAGRWHGRGRLGYSITPRFAPTSTEPMLQMVGQLRQERPDLWLQTHAAENRAEVDLVRQLFNARSYIDVYDRFGLLGPRSVFAHCVHIDDQDRTRLAATHSSIAFCPTSNLFLGSGLFQLDAARAAKVQVGLGTDIGAGTSYSPLQTLAEAYKVQALQGKRLSALRGFYLATLGGARVLHLDQQIGNFQPGKEADFVVLDWAATPTLARRAEIATSFSERLFALMTLGDERAVAATYVMGKRHHAAPARS